MDNAFEQTIVACSKPRGPGNDGTWLVDEMIEAYISLHELGYAHSIEAWYQNRLVGGLYGVCVGGSFFGESMFSFEADASKIALVALINHLIFHGFDLIDCQVTTGHLLKMGAVEISRDSFLKKIKNSVVRKMDSNIWDPKQFLYPFPMKEKNNEIICPPSKVQ